MKRLLVLFCLLLASCSRPLPEGVTELVYATPYPPSHPFSRADQRWMEFVERRSGGKLVIRPIWSGALLSSDMSLEELRHGVADIGLITPIYSKGGTHLIRTQSGFYSGADSIASQLKVYDCIARASPEVANELDGLKVLAIQGGLLPGILTRDRKVETLHDLKGLRLRAPTELLAVLKSLGADPVNLPMGEVYSALAKGVIDGVVAPTDTLKALHFVEVAKYFYELRVPRGAYPSRAMNAARWNALTPGQREILDESSRAWEAALNDEIRKSELDGRKEGEGKIIFTRARPEDQAAFDRAYLIDAEANAQRLNRFDIDGMKAFRAARQSVIARDLIKCGGAT